ncbi:7591_t:CDS:2 [Ambispora leptoticha]|uniref:7591_t:CDS:1 n=1 Tax=Ambispora leptoticha TaxID=144679 RepID=A0A9N9NA53_9GLOM|nr:7591_t:CDS:2 [Ambispora leptoticha]
MKNPSTKTTFLDITLDTEAIMASIPPDKKINLVPCIDMLNNLTRVPVCSKTYKIVASYHQQLAKNAPSARHRIKTP